MKRIFACVFFLVGLSLAGQTPQKPRVEIVSPMAYGSMGKMYDISEPGFVYSGQYGSFGEIDAKNFVVHAFLKKRHVICGKLTGGHWEAKEEGGIDALDFITSYPLPSPNDNSKYLLVILEQSSAYGSSENDHYAQVWRLRDGKLSIEQQILYNTHFSDEYHFELFSKKDNSLKVRSSHYLEQDAHCCISGYDELTFRWNGSEYQLSRIETKRLQPAYENGNSKKN